MQLNRTRIRLTAWLALLAVALNAFWPLLAQARPAQAGETGFEVCTVAGIRHLGTKDEAPARGQLVPHCAFCTLGAGHAPLAAMPACVLPPAPFSFGAVAPRDTGPHLVRFGFESAQPRAPPLVS